MQAIGNLNRMFSLVRGLLALIGLAAVLALVLPVPHQVIWNQFAAVAQADDSVSIVSAVGPIQGAPAATAHEREQRAVTEFIARHGVTTPFADAPEICIEIVSPSNTASQMSEKAAAYLEAGASEVWLVSDDAGVKIITKDGPSPSSAFGVELTLPS